MERCWRWDVKLTFFKKKKKLMVVVEKKSHEPRKGKGTQTGLTTVYQVPGRETERQKATLPGLPGSHTQTCPPKRGEDPRRKRRRNFSET
jgi:hypothetical protein